MSMTVPIMAVVAAVILGFLAGLFTFRLKERWCPHCGSTTVPLDQRTHHPRP